jgi:hypothetical protein
MPYQNDMSTLADVVGPAYAAMQAGIQNDATNAKTQLDLQTAQAQQPAEIQKPFLANMFQQAQTEEAQQRGLGQGLQNYAAQQTMPGAIGATNAKNQLAQTQADSGKLLQLGQLAGQVAGYMDNIPPPARQAAMSQILQQNGVDPSRLGVLANGDPDMLRSFSQKAIQASSSYQEKLMEQNMRFNEATTVAGIQGDTSRAVANIGKEGRVEAAQLQAETKKQLANMQQVAGQLYAKVAAGTASPEERAALQNMTQVMQLIRSNPFPSSITGTNVVPSVPAIPDTTQTTPTQPDLGKGPLAGNQPSPSDVEAEMRRRGLLK